MGAPANPNGRYVQRRCFWGNGHLLSSRLSPVLLESKRSLPLIVGKGGVGSAGCGVKHFWGGLALGKLIGMWDCRGSPGSWALLGVADGGFRLSGWVGTGQLWLCQEVELHWRSESGRVQDKSSLTPRPFSVDLGSMQVCASSALLIQITFYGHFCLFHCGLIYTCA